MILSEKMYERIDGRSLELVFDLSSGSVSGAFVYFEKGTLPKIMYKYSEDIVISPKLDPESFRRNSMISLNNVCKNLIEEGAQTFELEEIFKEHRNPDRAHIFFSSPWLDLDIKNLVFKKDKGSFEEFAEKLIDQSDGGKEEGIISRDVNSVKIRGYAVDITKSHKGLNEQLDDGELSYVNSTMSQKDLNLINGLIERNFSLEEIYHYPFYKVLKDSIKSFYKIDKDFICMDLTSEVTDVFVTKDRELALNFTIPFGRSKVYRLLIEKGLAGSVNQARSILNSYVSGHIDDGLGIKTFLEEAHHEFGDNFTDSISMLPEKSQPKDIFVISDKDNLPFLRIFIKNHFEDKNLIIIDKNKILENIEVKDDNYDNFIALETLFIS